MKHDDAALESELLREVEQLSRKHFNHDINDLDYSSDEEDFADLEAMFLHQEEDEPNGEKVEVCADDILASLPSFELFQSSSQLAIKAYGQILEKVEDSRISLSNDKNSPDDRLRDDCNVTLGINMDKSKSDSTVEEKPSGSAAMNVINTIVDKSYLDEMTDDDKMKRSVTRDIEKHSVCESKSLAWMEVGFDSNRGDIVDSLEEIERETKEEQLVKRIKRKEGQRQREILISKERVNHARLGNAANSLQLIIRSFISRRRTARNELFRVGIVKMMNVIVNLSLRNALQGWVQGVAYCREARRIAGWLRWNYKRRQVEFKDRMILRNEILRKIVDIAHFRRYEEALKIWRSFLGAQRDKERIARKIALSVLILQCVVRSHLSRLRVHQLREKLQRSSVEVIQSCWRRFVARKSYQSLQDEFKIKRTNAAICIQKVFRSVRVRRRFKQALRERLSYQDCELEDIFENDVELMVQNMIDTSDGSIHVGSQSGDWKPELPKITLEKLPINELPNTDIEDQDIQNVLVKSDDPPPHKHKKLMDEWNISDKRVIESMMKRKDRMNQIKRRDERSKKLSNPLFRLKKILRRKV